MRLKERLFIPFIAVTSGFICWLWADPKSEFWIFVAFLLTIALIGHISEKYGSKHWVNLIFSWLGGLFILGLFGLIIVGYCSIIYDVFKWASSLF